MFESKVGENWFIGEFYYASSPIGQNHIKVINRANYYSEFVIMVMLQLFATNFRLYAGITTYTMQNVLVYKTKKKVVVF